MTKTKAPSKPFNWPLFRTSLGATMTVLLIGGIGAGAMFGMKPLENAAIKIQGSRPTTVRIAWPPAGGAGETVTEVSDGAAPTWLAEQFQQELLARAHNALFSQSTRDTFSDDTLKAVGDSMATSGWFDSPPTVVRRPTGVIQVSGKWRIPACVVRIGAKDVLVSWDAKLMPPQYAPGQSGLTVIQGLTAVAPRSASGELNYLAKWPDEDLPAALELLALLVKQPWYGQVAAIDVAGYHKTRSLQIVTKKSGRIAWGGRPSDPKPGETTTAGKIATLDRLNAATRSIDANRPAIEVFGTQPLEIDMSASSIAAGQ